jgi:signal transduction histidine kinase
MWKALWKKWTIDKPALAGDWLWDVFVVQLAAYLDRLTLRQIVAFIPVVILVLAWYHRIPLPPELMLLGDVLAYIDIFSALFLLGILTRAATILFIIRQAAARVASLASSLMTRARRLDFRHRRERVTGGPKRWSDRSGKDDDARVFTGGVAWA